MIKPEGLHVDSEGVWVGNRVFFPIAQAALAYCSSIKNSRFKKLLSDFFPNISVDDIEVPHDLLLAVNNKPQFISLSGRNLLSAKVKSRSSNNPYEISVSNATLDKIEDLVNVNFKGGSVSSEKKLGKGLHWTSGFSGLKTESSFINSLPSHARKHYLSPVSIADFTHYIALISAYKIIKAGRFELIGFSESSNFSRSSKDFLKKLNNDFFLPLPYDFDKNPWVAVKAAVMRYAEKKPLSEINSELKYFIDDLLTDPFKQGVDEGIVRKGSLISSKKFTSYSWALIQAFENYLINNLGFDKNLSSHYDFGNNLNAFVFSRFTPEFLNSDFETHAIRFALPDDAARLVNNPINNLRVINNCSVSIIYDDNFQVPYFLYHDYSPKLGLNGFSKLGDRDPRFLISQVEEIHGQNEASKHFFEVDFWSNKPSLCSIHPPNLEILVEASLLSKKSGYGISVEKLKEKYVRAAKSYNLGKK